MVEVREVSVLLLLRRQTVAFAGLSCFVLVLPRLARAQAEELPPELAAEQNMSSPTRPAQASSQAMDAPQAVPTPIHRPTVLVVPYLGLTLPVGDGWAGFNAGPRFGALLGWHATDRLSLNGECDLDYARPDPRPWFNLDGPRPSFWDGFWNPPVRYIDLTFSPLVSLRAGQVRLGPKIGWFTSKESVGAVPTTGSGLLVGFNAGLFLPYRSVSVGGMLTGSFRVFTSTNEPYGAHHTMALLAAVLL